ncbi:DUF1833 family protein [Pseudomonas sp.]|uniref:DUF1833 family protein n=1 Tax=Pseudomonas sp. TaxID=306 RepID=UPI0019F49069|nr:DUF1833 family protein [Pseudomonas sp.]MBF0675596.1 DUF1833 family protein [Pseudomonas sp.]
MSILDQVYASGGDVILATLELSSPAWEASEFICSGFEDQSCTTEDGRTVTFTAAAMDAVLPEKGNSGSQSLTFALDGVMGVIQRKIDEALEAGERVTVVYRTYLASDLSAPAEAPYRFTVKGGELNGTLAQIQAGFFDILNHSWPRKLYTVDFAPGLTYIS